MDLVAKFWNFCHTLRHEGIEYSDYIEELTYLLFLKLADEKGVKIPEDCKWKSLIANKKTEILSGYNQILEKLSRDQGILGDIFMHPIPKIRSASALIKLLDLIDEENWSKHNEDILGAMFEGLLEKAASESKKGTGQYFTPRPLIEAIVTVMQPDPLESDSFRISDVACGTGGFLISSFDWLKKKYDINSIPAKQLAKILSKTYYGQELVLRPRRMAQMNMYLHGLSPNILLGDTIYQDLKSNKKELFRCVLTNPPFGTRGADQIPNRKDFLIKTSNKQLNFVQHVNSCLEDKGRAAIVLPDNVLTEEKGKELWKHLMKFCDVHTILRLPSGTFQPYANVKAVVVFLQKGKPTKQVWIYDARHGKENITKTGRPLESEHFKEFTLCYGKSPNGDRGRNDIESERFRAFSIDQIEKRNFNLDITWDMTRLKSPGIDIPKPEEALRFAVHEMEQLVEEMKRLLTQIT